MNPSLTFKLHHDTKHIRGMIDRLEAVKQAVFLMLSVPRLEHLIYSQYYGHEINELAGKDDEYVYGDIERVIREALMIDDRISNIENFEFRKYGENFIVTFRIITIFGSFDSKKEVNINGI